MGTIWKLGDDIDTDIIIPTQFLAKKTIMEMKEYAFYPLRKELPKMIKEGDIIVAGKNFGCGSSREQAPEVIKGLGVKYVVAKSFARIFYRNAINNGIFLIENQELPELCKEGELIEIDIEDSHMVYLNRTYHFSRITKELIRMVKEGGLVPFMKKQNESKVK